MNKNASAIWQQPGVNVTKVGLIGDGMTDNTTALQTLINKSPEGTVFYFPAGTYLINGKVDFIVKPLRNWTFVGDVDNNGAPASIVKGTIANSVVISANYDGGGGIFQCRNLQFIASANSTAFACDNAEAGSVFENCIFKGFIGLFLLEGFDTVVQSCQFTGYGSATTQKVNTTGGPELLGWGKENAVSIGLLSYLPTCQSVMDCTFTGWTEGIRAGGSGINIMRSTFSRNSLALRLGSQPNGYNWSLGPCYISDSTFNDNDVAAYCQNLGGSFFYNLTIKGSNLAPSGQSQYGIWTSARCTIYDAVTISGRFTANGIFAHDATNYTNFYGCNVTNSYKNSKAWYIGSGTTETYVVSTPLVNLIPYSGLTSADKYIYGQAAVIDVTSKGVLNDGVTDCSIPMQTLINNSLPGAVFYFPSGTYAFTTKIDFSSLVNFALLGDSLNSSIILGAGNAANGWKSPSMLINIDYANSSGKFKLSNIRFVGGIYAHNAAMSAIENCSISSDETFPGIKMVNPFGCTIRNTGFAGGNYDRTGLVLSGSSACTVENCVFMGLKEGIRANGSRLSVLACRFEVDAVALNLGIDPNGNAASLQSSLFGGITFEANDTCINVTNCSNCSFTSMGSQGHQASPSGTSQQGIIIDGKSYNCVFAGMGMGGSYAKPTIQILPGASNITFSSCLMTNNTLIVPVWDMQSTNNIYRISCLTLK